MKNCLPRNLICLDLLVGPFSPEHPREIYMFSPHPPTTRRVLQTICGRLTTGPMVPLAPFCPTNPISPCSPIGPVSPRWPWWPLLPWREAISEQVCSECTNFPWTVVRVVWQFKHLILKVYLTSTSNVMLMEVTGLTVYYYNRELFNPSYKRANCQTSKNERCILAPRKWTDKPFLLVFLFHQFCQVYPLDPGKRKSNRVVSGQKELSFHWNWLKFGVGCWDTHPYTHQARRPKGSLHSFQADFTPVSFSSLWTRIPLFTLRRVVQVQWKRWSYNWVTISWTILV